MSYRGRGGYKGDLGGGVYTLDDSGGNPDDMPTYDFSDVTGGSSTAGSPDYSSMDLSNVLTGGLGSLGNIFGSGGAGSAIQKFLGSAGSLGPGVGAAVASGAVSGVAAVKKALAGHARARLAKAFGTSSGRRMNPLNVRAARRALRRLHGFDRIAKSILHVTSPKKKVHGFRFKRRKRH